MNTLFGRHNGYTPFRPASLSDSHTPTQMRPTSSMGFDMTTRGHSPSGDWGSRSLHEELHAAPTGLPYHSRRRKHTIGRHGSPRRPHSTHRSFMPLREREDSCASLIDSEAAYPIPMTRHGSRRGTMLPGPKGGSIGPARDQLTPGLGLGFTVEDLIRPLRSRLTEVEDRFDEVQRVNETASRRARLNTMDLRDEMFEKAMDEETGQLHAENLQDHHFTNEDLCRVIFERCNSDDDHELDNFRDLIMLDPKGGLDRIDDIWNPIKYLYFLVLVGCCIFNFIFIVSLNYSIFHFWFRDVVTRTEAFYSNTGDVYTFLHDDLSNVTETAATDAFREALRNHMQLSGLMLIQDASKRIMFMEVAIVVALMESMWILYLLLLCIWLWWEFAWDSSEYRSYRALSTAFQKLLPQFSNFSAIKLMARAHPALIYNEYMSEISDSVYKHHTIGFIYINAVFALKLAFSASLALCAFLVKLVVVALNLVNPAYSPLTALLGVVGLLNQCIGCIVMEIVLQDRLFLFMFGGRDATYKEDQLAYKNVYECRVAKTIWETYWHGKVAGNPGGRRQRLKALVMLATFDHYDLQMLVMDRFDAPRMGGLPCVEEEYLEGDGEDDEDEEEEDDQEDDLELGGAASAAAAAAAPQRSGCSAQRVLLPCGCPRRSLVWVGPLGRVSAAGPTLSG
mmetsp:Transcript_37668/g.88099  ORF Transcript_37668/g.88099 Transcript_37668/m.88099 type:complete len:678 (+) Transcript_37668:114-2147(+)